MNLDRRDLGLAIDPNVDYVEWDLFDTITLKGGETTRVAGYSAFTEILCGKEWTDTNMCMSGMLPMPQSFTINTFMCICNRFRSEVHKRDSEIVWDNGVVELLIGQKIQLQTTLARFPMNSDYQTLWTEKGRKWIVPRPIHFSKHKPTILQQMFFQVRLRLPVLMLSTDVKVKIVMNGELRRGVW